VAVVAFDALGTLFDLGEMETRMPPLLQHALSLTVVGGWAPLDELAAALDPELADRLPELEPQDGGAPALERVRASADDAWVLTNGGRDATARLLERGGLDALVAEIRSAEDVRRYKPHAEVYELLPAEATLVTAHAWDAAGAVAAGRRAVWANPEGRPWPYAAILRPAEVAPDLLAATGLALTTQPA
jgi:2-haloacid dehalogenase